MASTVASHFVRHLSIRRLRTFSFLIPYFLFLILLSACSSSKFISKQSNNIILSDSNFTAAHIGISIYDPSSNKYLYQHQAEKYFIPASNTKLFTCYAAMKHLGDSLVGWFFKDTLGSLYIKANADPTFLNDEFRNQSFFELLKTTTKQVSLEEANSYADFQIFGSGWAWNDMNESYMVKRSPMPLYSNLVTFRWANNNLQIIPRYFDSSQFIDKALLSTSKNNIYIEKDFASNHFWINYSEIFFKEKRFPFTGDQFGTLEERLLNDTIKRIKSNFSLKSHNFRDKIIYQKFHSQPTDSLLKPMMHRSDNFFAEQTLLMVSNEMTGVMNDTKIIDRLLKTDLKDLPQKPRWVDGSGLSRYNLFSPNDLVTVLNKMKNEFDWNRITTILPTGNEGTLSNYYKNLKGRIFAKTGTLSNNIALSGFLITKQNKTLIFSVLVNNHMGNTSQIRRAVEKLLTAVAEKY